MKTRDGNSERVWFVTGSSRGFGQALATTVLARGERLVATARHPEFVEEFGEEHPEALALRLDVTDGAQARRAVTEAVDRFGRVDVVVNNAGYGHFGAIEELTEAELRQQFEVNLFGVLNVTRAALPQLRAQRSGTSFRCRRRLRSSSTVASRWRRTSRSRSLPLAASVRQLASR